MLTRERLQELRKLAAVRVGTFFAPGTPEAQLCHDTLDAMDLALAMYDLAFLATTDNDQLAALVYELEIKAAERLAMSKIAPTLIVQKMYDDNSKVCTALSDTLRAAGQWR